MGDSRLGPEDSDPLAVVRVAAERSGAIPLPSLIGSGCSFMGGLSFKRLLTIARRPDRLGQDRQHVLPLRR